MLKRLLQQSLLVVTYSVVLFIFSACSESSYNDDSYQYNPAWVKIEYPSSNPYTIDKEFIRLSGTAFISDGWARCCSGSPTDTGVTVTWRNDTTGVSSYAIQYITYGSFLGYPYIKSHSWSAEVQLDMGRNAINVTAFDPDYSETKHITVTREVDTTPPTVIWNRPNDQAINISIYTYISASFSESINCDSVYTDTLVVTDNNDIPVTGTLTCSSLYINFTTLGNLAYDTLYSVTIKAGIEDLVGLTMSNDHNWSFTTASDPSIIPDTISPSISWVEPTDNSSYITTDQTIKVHITEPFDPRTVNDKTFTIKGPDNILINSAITYDLDIHGLIIYIQPYLELAPSTVYKVTVSPLVTDMSGNHMPMEHTWSFTTQAQTKTH